MSLALLVAAVAVCAAGCAQEEEAKPSLPSLPPRPVRAALTNGVRIANVILISIDTLRADHLGCYGHEFVRTPNIDALAAEGMLFTQCVSAAPTTLSSHTSLMTGTYPHTHGVVRNGYEVNRDNIMLAEVLGDAGFATAAFVAAFPLDGEFGFDQGFDHFNAEYDMIQQRGVRDQTQRRADKLTDAVLEWLDERDGGAGASERLFLFVHYFDPHWPYDAPAPYGRMYRRDTRPLTGSMKMVNQTRRLLYDPETRQEGLDLTRIMDAEYCAEISYCDYHVGRLLKGLGTRGLYEDSLILLVSDHGETMHEHDNLFNHGESVYETEIHIPLMVRFPQGRFGGRRQDRLCSNVDVLPTILHLLDLPENGRIEGHSFARLIDGPLPPRSPVFAEATQPMEEAFNRDAAWLNRAKFQGVRTRRYKYASRLADKRAELYDLRADPGEQVNLLMGQHEYDQAQYESLREQLERWRDNPRPLPSRMIDEAEVLEKLKSLGYLQAKPSEEGQGE